MDTEKRQFRQACFSESQMVICTTFQLPDLCHDKAGQIRRRLQVDFKSRSYRPTGKLIPFEIIIYLRLVGWVQEMISWKMRRGE